MKRKLKQIAALLIMLIFYLPFLLYGNVNEDSNRPLIFGLLFLFGLISIPVIQFIWHGDEDFNRQPWEVEGFSSYGSWFKNSKSFYAKFQRLLFNLIWISFLLFITWMVVIIFILGE